MFRLLDVTVPSIRPPLASDILGIAITYEQALNYMGPVGVGTEAKVPFRQPKVATATPFATVMTPVFSGERVAKILKKNLPRLRFYGDSHGPRGRMPRRLKGAGTIRAAFRPA